MVRFGYKGDLMEEKFKVRVSVVGVKKRGRKAEQHTIPAGYLPYSPEITDAQKSEILSLAKSVAETNMKNFNNLKVHLYHVTIDEGIEQMVMFSDKHVTLRG
jgi:hypothetical protein